LAFQVKPPNWGEVLGDELPFGFDGEAAFRSLLESCYQYLEYGAGASSFAAARAGVALVSVESDPRFLAAVENRCRSIAPMGTGEERFLHGDIGRTGPWGKPVFPSMRRPVKWSRYPLAPWQKLGENFRADLVLVDGRFRVACALAVIAHQPDTSWTLLVDDYLDRDEYKPIAQFAELVAMHGRMAQFRSKAGVQHQDISNALAHFVSDWR